MTDSKSKLKEVLELMQSIGEIKGIADLLIPEIDSYANRMADGITDIRIKQVKRYEAAGFTREQAILMTIDGKVSLQNALSNANKK